MAKSFNDSMQLAREVRIHAVRENFILGIGNQPVNPNAQEIPVSGFVCFRLHVASWYPRGGIPSFKEGPAPMVRRRQPLTPVMTMP